MSATYISKTTPTNFLEAVVPQEVFFTEKTEKKFLPKMKQMYEKTIKVIVDHSIQAVDAFEKREFSKFDALVGDQACQIRSLKIALLANNIDFVQELKESKSCLEQFKEDKCEIGLSNDVQMVILSYLLTVGKVSSQSSKSVDCIERYDPEKLIPSTDEKSTKQVNVTVVKKKAVVLNMKKN